MQQRDTIVQLVIGYIERLQQTGVDDRYFDEIQTSLSNRFRFLDKTDDFTFAADLAQAMQDYPIEHVLDADFFFDHYSQDGVEQVLSQLSRDRLRIWYISKDEPTNQEMYFYAGKYSIEEYQLPASEVLIASVDATPLALPQTNRLLPKNFSIHGALETDKPTAVANIDFDLFQVESEFFDNQPKGIIVVELNADIGSKSAENSVMGDLWESLYNLKNAGFIEEASVAGLGVNVGFGYGIEFSVTGFTDRQNEAIKRIFNSFNFDVTEQDLEQAVDRYLRSIINAEHEFPFRQLLPAYNALVVQDVFSKEDRIAAVKSITLKDLDVFREQLVTDIVPRSFMLGNYRKSDAISLAKRIKEHVSIVDKAHYKSAIWRPEANQFFNVEKSLPVEDLAMFWVFADTYEDVKRRAAAHLLSEHASNEAFNTLRTEEQLAYAVGITSMPVEDFAGLAMYIQTPVINAEETYDRFDRFRTEYQTILADLDRDTFDTLQAGVLNSLTQEPKNIYQEFNRMARDWDHPNYTFDSRQRMIEAIQSLQPDDLKALYYDLVMQDDAPQILIQLRGSKFIESPFATHQGAKTVDKVDTFQNKITKQ